MDEQANPKLELSEAIEACRPDSDDLSDPALARLAAELSLDSALAQRFRRVQRADRRIAAAMADVAPPAGLRERILVRLAEATAQPDADVESVSPSEAPSHELEELHAAPQRRRWSRRWLAIGVGAVAAAATLLAAVWINLPGGPTYTPQAVLVESQEFFAGDAFGDGELLSEAAPPRGLPLSPDVVRRSGIRWRQVDGLLGATGVAYDLPGPAGTRATLYVVRRTVPGLPDHPPRRPVLSTGGCALAAWQEGPLLYVLAVAGREATYRYHLDVPSGPVAQIPRPTLQSSKSV